jgi:ATP-dependent DNA helicase Rep
LRVFGEFINRIAWRAAREPAAQVLDDLVAAIGYREHLFDTLDDKAAAQRWTNVGDFVDWLKKRAADDGSTLAQLAQSVSLLSQLDRKDENTDAVRLTTIHAAKGLEFGHVFIVGCEEGLLPHRGDAAAESEADAGGTGEAGAPDALAALRIEEERRLMYVAVTRAQRSLTLTWCRRRKRARELLSRLPSRFIAEMQLDANPGATRTVSTGTARERLGQLRDLLGGARKAAP